LICDSELELKEPEGIWYCPRSDHSFKVKTEQEGVLGDRDTKSKKAHYTCKNCDIDLKYSRKLGAWYCKKCHRVYKQRVKTKEEKKEIEADLKKPEPLESEKVAGTNETAETVADADKKLEDTAEVSASGDQAEPDKDIKGSKNNEKKPSEEENATVKAKSKKRVIVSKSKNKKVNIRHKKLAEKK
jgi:ribosomal protein L37AE/L43A